MAWESKSFENRYLNKELCNIGIWKIKRENWKKKNKSNVTVLLNYEGSGKDWGVRANGITEEHLRFSNTNFKSSSASSLKSLTWCILSFTTRVLCLRKERHLSKTHTWRYYSIAILNIRKRALVIQIRTLFMQITTLFIQLRILFIRNQDV